jgi:hypothetical protein
MCRSYVHARPCFACICATEVLTSDLQNRSFLLVYSQGEGRSSGLSVAYMTIPPKDGDACDQSQLTLPFSAESLSNKTELIGTPVYQAHSDAHALVGGSAKGAAALALVVAGVTALL